MTHPALFRLADITLAMAVILLLDRRISYLISLRQLVQIKLNIFHADLFRIHEFIFMAVVIRLNLRASGPYLFQVRLFGDSKITNIPLLVIQL